MVSLVEPEKGVLATLVQTLRTKEAEGRALVSVLNDVLRGLTGELPARPPPVLEEVDDGAAKSKRLESLTEEPKRTLQRLMSCIEALAKLMGPLVPSVAHALDRVALICVREMDRLASCCHKDYENLRTCWKTAEEQRNHCLG